MDQGDQELPMSRLITPTQANIFGIDTEAEQRSHLELTAMLEHILRRFNSATDHEHREICSSHLQRCQFTELFPIVLSCHEGYSLPSVLQVHEQALNCTSSNASERTLGSTIPMRIMLFLLGSIEVDLLDCELPPGTQACERPACDNDKEELLRKRHINAT